MKLPSYSTRIMISYIFLVVLAGILSVGSTYYIRQALKASEIKLEQNAERGMGAKRLEPVVRDRAEAAHMLFLTGEARFANRWTSLNARFNKTFAEIIQEKWHHPECAVFHDQIKDINKLVVDGFESARGGAGGGASAPSLAVLEAEYQLLDLIDDFVEAQRDHTRVDAAAALAQTERAMRAALAVSAWLVGLAMFMSLYVHRTLRKPLDRLLQGARKIQAGQLDHRVDWSQPDEIGELTLAFDEMSSELSRKDFLITRQVNELTGAKRTLEAYSHDLENKNREMEGFIYSVSHDLKAPLIAIQGFLAMFAEQFSAGLSKEALFYLDRVQANGKQMQALIQHLLELSRAGETAGAFTRVDTRSLVEQVLGELELQIKSSGGVVRMVGRWPTITAEPVRLKQALINLVDNALYYRQDETPVEVEVGIEELPEAWRFFVKDNGMGIDPQYHNRVFNMFERLTEGHAKNEQGTGVGLAIVKRVAESHGGKVELESKPNHGSTFYFEIAKGLAAKETAKAGV
jgi:signal transduction histidine kinase